VTCCVTPVNDLTSCFILVADSNGGGAVRRL